jgi:two-component system, repressor protein LuxO
MLPREIRAAERRLVSRRHPVVATGGTRAGDAKPEIRPLAEVERATIESAIAACNGNLTEAAKYLDINVSTIHRKRQSWLARAS